jgi:eukaryotic-like serine/threonine-protein kinase
MIPHRWSELERLYEKVLALPVDERSRFLHETCGGDLALLREVEALLRYEGAAEHFLERPALQEAARNVQQDRSTLKDRLVGGFQILEFIGEGGMGEVYRARDVKLERDVALKVLPAEVADDPESLRRFRDEARLASGLNHPNVVTIYGIVEEGELACIAMELVHGRTLRDVLVEEKVAMPAVLDVAAQLASALAAAHAGGIVHRDLKPENVMVTSGRLVKVLDFGVAGRLATPSPAAPSGRQPVRGTAGYMSPEQAAGHAAGHASDQFSFGVILYEMLAGRCPFERVTPAETLAAIVHEQPPTLGRLEVPVPAPFRRVIERCLSKDPADRYRDTGELAEEVARIRDDESRRARWSRRHVLWIGGSAALAGVAGLTAWRVWPRSAAIESVAVLPFANAARDQDTEYLSDGITESLIQRISAVQSLRVMARSTVFNLKGKGLDPRAAGRQLGVDAILIGTVERRGSRLLISAELVDVASGVRLWGNAYERAAATLLSLQDEIANAIVDDGIRLRLSGDERRRLVRHPTNNPEAYELYLRALHQHRQENEHGYLSARELLQQAVAKDPAFAAAYSALGATYIVMAVDGFEPPIGAGQLANRYIGEALRLDPELANAHGEAASAAFFFDWDWARAEREWERAMASGTFEPDWLLGYSLERWALGRLDDAVRLSRNARDLDPLSPTFAVRHADFLVQSGEIDAALRIYADVIHDQPGDPRAYLGLAEARRAQGRFDDAIEARRQDYAAAQDDSLGALLSTARGAAGWREIERDAVRIELESLGTRQASLAYVSPLDFARAHAQLGETEQAFQYLAAAFADRAPGLVFLRADRAWERMRKDPRFLSAVRRVGLP